jgi:hypothetical protein
MTVKKTRAPGAGRPEIRPGTVYKRSTIRVSALVYDYLNSSRLSVSAMVENMVRERMSEDTKYFYCKNCGAIWYKDENGKPLFYAWMDGIAAPLEIAAAAAMNEAPCGCTE